ncbi:hypothetical protein KI387_040309, partial [Taxus chinensis]
ENIIPFLGEWLRDKMLRIGVEREHQILHANLPPQDHEYDKEITLDAVINGWL